MYYLFFLLSLFPTILFGKPSTTSWLSPLNGGLFIFIAVTIFAIIITIIVLIKHEKKKNIKKEREKKDNKN